MNSVGPHPHLVRQMRNRASLNQGEWGALAGADQSRVSKAEAGTAPLAPRHWLALAPHIALRAEDDDAAALRKLWWVLTCANDFDTPDTILPLYDADGGLGLFFDPALAWDAARALAALGAIPFPCPMPCTFRYVIDTAQVLNDDGTAGHYYVVDERSGTLPAGFEELSRRARAAVYVGSVMQQVAHYGAQAVEGAAS